MGIRLPRTRDAYFAQVYAKLVDVRGLTIQGATRAMQTYNVDIHRGFDDGTSVARMARAIDYAVSGLLDR
jgi:hypothetical protein